MFLVIFLLANLFFNTVIKRNQSCVHFLHTHSPGCVSKITHINKSVEEAVRAQYEDVVFNTHIRDHVSLSEAPGSGGSIFDYDGKGRGAQDYLALTQEILDRTK